MPVSDQGLQLEDIEHLKELDDPTVLGRHRERNNRTHASDYFRAGAAVMEDMQEHVPIEPNR
jgi:hypothetical protein